MPLDFSSLPWQLSGWRPYPWKNARSVETTFGLESDIAAMPARLPGSLPQTLRDHSLIPDGNVGSGSREVGWVEHRHRIFTCNVPNDSKDRYTPLDRKPRADEPGGFWLNKPDDSLGRAGA